MNKVLLAFLLTLIAGLSTGIGSAIPFFFKKFKQVYLAFFLGLSAGVMVFISFAELLSSASEALGILWAFVAFFGGIIVVAVIDFLIPKSRNPHHMPSDEDCVSAIRAHCLEEAEKEALALIEKIEEVKLVEKSPEDVEGGGTDVRVATIEGEKAGVEQQKQSLIRAGTIAAIGIAIHNFPEGIATFATTLSDTSLGITIMLAIAIHNIPEGIGVSVPIFYATRNKWKSFGLSLASGLAEPVGAIITYAILLPFLSPAILAGSLAFVAGIMVYISIDELIPIAHEYGAGHVVMGGIVLGMLIMAASLILFQYL